MRDLLRREIQEETADQWSDIQLNTALDFGVFQVEKAILGVDAEAFVHVYKINIESGKDWYPLPTSFVREIEVGLLEGTGYSVIPAIEYAESRGANAPASDTRYSIIGRYIALTPVPSANLTDGLRLLFVPVLTMAEDTDTPDIPDVLHVAAVLYAKMLLLEETGEPLDGTERQVARIMADLPLWYQRGAPSHLTPSGMADKMSW
jgi:hypothetical protein